MSPPGRPKGEYRSATHEGTPVSGPNVLVTGAGGYLGSQLVAALAAGRIAVGRVVAADVRDVPSEQRLPGVEYAVADVRAPELADLFVRCRPDVVVHLASIVTPGRRSSREFEYAVDVQGTENVLRACLACGAARIIVSSSGAAYGYHADNPAWIGEDAPLRGNEAFAYSWHKRLVEEMLARWRIDHPGLEQVVLRIGTILGETVHNQITDLFEKPRLIAIRGSASPFVFIWDQDVVDCILHAISTGRTGCFNVAGDGALSIHEIAERLGKRCLVLPAWLLQGALAALRASRPDPVRPGTGRLPALPAGARQHPAQDRVRLRAAQDLVRSVRLLARGARSPAAALSVRDFSDKVVVVTGAAGGLGRALCLRFGAAGARIVALDRDAGALEACVAALKHDGVRAIGEPCDVTREDDCRRAVAEARRVFGGIDVLVNNAGITHRSAFARTDPAVIRRVMEVNFFGALHCTHAALPDLLARKGGLIAVSSVAGFAPLIARTGYAASKHALHGFFDSLRSEVEPLGVSVLLVCPSFIQTGIEKHALGGDGGLARHPQSVVGTRATAQATADQIFDAARSGRRLLLPGTVARTSWWVSRLAPRLYERLMVRRLRDEMQAE